MKRNFALVILNEVQHISGLALSTTHNREIIFCGLHVTRNKKYKANKNHARPNQQTDVRQT